MYYPRAGKSSGVYVTVSPHVAPRSTIEFVNELSSKLWSQLAPPEPQTTLVGSFDCGIEVFISLLGGTTPDVCIWLDVDNRIFRV